MLTRRELIKIAGFAGAGAFAFPVQGKAEGSGKAKEAKFRFCLNTSTIRGQDPGLKGYIDIASKAGYDGIELWVRDVKAFLDDGNKASELKRYIEDKGLKVENAIGFAEWLADDDAKRKQGFAQMEAEMEMMASVGGTRIAAAPAGLSGEKPVDLLWAGEKYAELLNLGRKTGVMPQLEFWGASPAIWHLGQVMAIAAAANDKDVHILPDIYHLFRGDSGFEGLRMLSGNVIEVFHVNDFVDNIPRTRQKDSDRVYPGDGAAPVKEIFTILKNMGGTKVLSVELFNENYYKQDPLTVAKTALAKTRKIIDDIN